MEAIYNELKTLGELWRKEIEHTQKTEIEERMKLYRRLLEMVKKGFRISDLEWILE